MSISSLLLAFDFDPSIFFMPRTKQTAKKSTGGLPPSKQNKLRQQAKRSASATTFSLDDLLSTARSSVDDVRSGESSTSGAGNCVGNVVAVRGLRTGVGVVRGTNGVVDAVRGDSGDAEVRMLLISPFWFPCAETLVFL